MKDVGGDVGGLMCENHFVRWGEQNGLDTGVRGGI